MDEDIDIEEHDILDNPAIKRIFPDLSILKQEIVGCCDEASNIKQETDASKATEELITSADAICNYGKEISSTENSDTEPEIIFVEKRQPPLYGNKIILGSKPAVQCQVKIESEKITEKIYSSKIQLEDIGLYLEKSKKFCSFCQILFPSIASFQSHDKTHHKNSDESLTGTPLYECDKCHRKFSKHGSMVMHIRKVHHRNTRTRSLRSDNVMSQISRTKRSIIQSNKLESNPMNKCFHCNKTFSSKKAIIEHIYTVLRSKERSGIESKVLTKPPSIKNKVEQKCLRSLKSVPKSNPSTNIIKKTVPGKRAPVSISLYRCFYCSYYFTHKRFYAKHIRHKHKDEKPAKGILVVFNGQCKYCSKECGNWKYYNTHLLMEHSEKVNNIFKLNPKIVIPKLEKVLTRRTEKVVHGKIDDLCTDENNDFDNDDEVLSNILDHETTNRDTSGQDLSVLNSVLFKCKKCDIHFLTARLTMKHTEHMEMLINWKCHACQKIFKKNDEIAHRRQHLCSSKFITFEMDAYELERVLYKCTKCAIHFSEDDYFSHYKTCENGIAESAYCKLCDFLIAKNIAGLHFGSHKLKKIKPVDFTIINSEVLTYNKTENSTLNKVNNELNDKTDRDNIKKDKVSVVNKIKKRKIKKYSNHKINFQDMYFKLCYCEVCKSFITRGLIRDVHLESRCGHTKTHVCKDCGLVFSHNSIKGHKKIHQKIKGIKLQDFTFYAMHNGQQIVPPVPLYPKCYKCDVHFVSKAAIIDHICTNSDFLTCHLCNIKLGESVFKLHMSFHYYSKKNNNDVQSIVTNERKTKINIRKEPDVSQQELSKSKLVTNTKIKEMSDNQSTSLIIFSEKKRQAADVTTKDICKDTTKKGHHSVNTDRKSDYDLFDILYTCANCHTTIDSYDQVVEHCQDHVCGVNIETQKCDICKLNLERKYYSNHSKVHNSNENKKNFKLLVFDIFYFTLDDSIWLKHVFGSISEHKKESILSRTIYKNNKIKLKIIQDGLPELTVYKCNRCCIIVDPDMLVKHAETSCFKIRKYPCQFCGLPFLSYVARQEHQAIHKTRNIFLKSYRIVGFNQENDKRDNIVLAKPNSFFIMYQCRNCNGIIEKLQRSEHKCNKTDLKKCETCDLLVPSSDYITHCTKHENIPTFIQKNMKVVLFGQNDLKISDVNMQDNDGLNTEFDGTFIDYTLYRCVDCGVCFDKTQIARLRHNVCYDSALKSRCPQCDLFILKTKMPQHLKLHERHDDFVRENMNIIPYSVSELQANFIPVEKCKSDDTLKIQNDNHTICQELVPNITEHELVINDRIMLESEETKTVNELSERTAKLFKCTCGLHFLDNPSIQGHFSHCNTRIARQNCSKCNLIFTPNILFDHLLMHHGDKKINYKFKIISMSKKKCDIVSVYNCGKCNTKFVDHANANAHYDICREGHCDSEKCKRCNLLFSICSIKHHENDHHKNSVADIDIVDIGTYSRGTQPENSRVNNTIQADFVIDSKKYNISHDTLSQIDLSRYDNSIYKCDVCNTHFLTESTLRRHYNNGHILSPQAACDICDLRFSLQSLTKHVYIHHKQMNLNFTDFVTKFYTETAVQ